MCFKIQLHSQNRRPIFVTRVEQIIVEIANFFLKKNIQFNGQFIINDIGPWSMYRVKVEVMVVCLCVCAYVYMCL